MSAATSATMRLRWARRTRGTPTTAPAHEQIVARVATHYGLTAGQLRARDRHRHLVEARWVAMLLLQHAWQAAGGYGNQGEGRGRANAGREVLWFSPHTVHPVASLPLFSVEVS